LHLDLLRPPNGSSSLPTCICTLSVAKRLGMGTIVGAVFRS